MTTSPAPTSSLHDGDGDQFVRRNLRHNILALGTDFGLFLIGLSFASQATILPAFAAFLGAPNVVIGAIPAVLTVGWYLPALFVAGYTEALPRKLPFVLRFTVWERVPFLVLALIAFFLAERAPTLSLALLLIFLLVMSVAGGLLMPAWMDIIGRTIPTRLRGRFFALASVLGSVGGLFGSVATAYILATLPAPTSYAVCFLIGGLFFVGSYVALALTRELPARRTVDAVPLRAYLRRIPALLRLDRNLSWFLASRVFSVAATMASGFYTVYALRELAAPAWQVGVFTTILLLGQIVGNVALGWLADHTGHLIAVIAGVVAIIAGNLIALLAPSVETFSLAFAMNGIYLAANNVSGMNVMLEFAPTVDERPTYLGLGNTALGPVAFVAPLLGGVMADTIGFGPVFIVSALFGLASLGVMLLRVQDPRHQARST